MKLLFDNNLSHKLLEKTKDIFPDSTHVMHEKLDESEDQEILEFAKQNDFTIITKDSDFNDLILFFGYPPKVILLKIGNCKVLEIEKVLRDNIISINEFINNPEVGILEIA